MEVVGTLGVAQGKGPGTSCSFPSMQKALGECGSREAAVRLLWGGGEEVASVEEERGPERPLKPCTSLRTLSGI